MDLNKTLSEKKAGVIVLYEVRSDSFILTKRSLHLRQHPGEVCFPGGTWEEGDESLYATGLRELHEELGISPDRVVFIKELAVERTLLGSIIYPWLSYVKNLEPFLLNEEVTSVIRVPSSLIKDSNNYKKILVNKNGYQLTSLEFIGHKEYIWGATARILHQLGLTLRNLRPDAKI